MKKLLVGLSLLSSFTCLAAERPSEREMEKALTQAEFAADLWFCDAEESLKDLADSRGIDNNLGCANAIDKARVTLETDEIAHVFKKHLDQLKQLQKFEAEVQSGKGISELVPSVKALKAKGVALNLVKRNLDLSAEELAVVELSFEKSKTDLERALENL